MKNEKHSLKDYLRRAIVVALVAGGVLWGVVFVLTATSVRRYLDFSTTGPLGDTIGGITAPFIGVSAAILTFLAFYMQFKANEMHNLQFDLQSRDKERDKHENKILYLISQNRSIVESMSISYHGGTVEGSKCFARMFDEFRVAYEIVKSFYGDEVGNEEAINISFLLFYNGVGPTSNILNKAILKDTPRLDALFRAFDFVSSGWKGANARTGDYKREHSIEFDTRSLSRLEYKPFEGHVTRLGQYFRNLFHILSYTQSIDEKLISKEEKYEIIKSLRSQLSSYEQMLIYFNSLSLYGKPMRENGYIKDYKLIKNVPIPLVEFAGDIRGFYPGLKFEWDEIIKRAESC